jgi:hypothetical protein
MGDRGRHPVNFLKAPVAEADNSRGRRAPARSDVGTDGRLTEEPFAHGLDPLVALDALRDQIARSHGVTDPDARRRLLKLNELSREWIGVLRTPPQGRVFLA